MARIFLPLALLLLALPLAHARLSDGEFEEVRDGAKDEMDRATDLPDRKLRWIEKLGEDDHVRSVELLVDWAEESADLRRKTLDPALAEAVEDLERFESILKKSVSEWPPKSLPRDQKLAWDRKKAVRARAQAEVDAELEVRFALARALEKTRDEAAIDWLLKKGLKKLRRAEGAENAAQAVILAFTRAPASQVGKALLREAAHRKDAATRILALGWIGKEKPAAGLEIAADALEAREDAVKRAAVQALKALDDPHAVKPLIDALRDARGLVRIEIEDVLHHYTGESFLSSHAFWKKWWEEKGEAWLRSAAARERHGPRKVEGGGTYFYGLRTESDRIVFVLDRSGSMQTPASAEERAAGDAEVEGDTKIEAAKSQLVRSIQTLPKEARFNIVFYSDDVQSWKEPPAMLLATPENKEEAVEWVKAIEAGGSTQLFDGLLRALEYADNFDEKKPEEGGCDTIFLMSDGSPTDMDSGQPLAADAIEAAWARVTEANRVFDCVIHTVGVGARHNRGLLQRIAKETGGTYQAVGR